MIDELKNRLESLIIFLKEIDDFISNEMKKKELKEFILDLNRSDQLFEKREDSRGVNLGSIAGGYSDYTELINQGKSFTYKGVTNVKKSGEDPFLFDTGDFYKSFFISYNSGLLTIDANPFKDDTNLFNEYGVDILGLQEENIDKVIDAINFRFKNEVEKKIQQLAL